MYDWHELNFFIQAAYGRMAQASEKLAYAAAYMRLGAGYIGTQEWAAADTYFTYAADYLDWASDYLYYFGDSYADRERQAFSYINDNWDTLVTWKSIAEAWVKDDFEGRAWTIGIIDRMRQILWDEPFDLTWAARPENKEIPE